MGRILLFAALALAALLTAPSAGLAGGFATVGLSSLPDDARPGAAWVVDLTVLQHGRTPLEGVRPAIVIEPAGGGAEMRFRAKPTAEPGVYRARVVFPRAGEWRYAADDGFAAVHQLGRATIGTAAVRDPAAAPARPASRESADDGISVVAALAIAGAASLLAAGLVGPLGRRLSSRPA